MPRNHEAEQTRDIGSEIIDRAVEYFLQQETYSIFDKSSAGKRWLAYFPYDEGAAAFDALMDFELVEDIPTESDERLQALLTKKITERVPDYEEINALRIQIAREKNETIVKPPFDPEVLKRLQ